MKKPNYKIKSKVWLYPGMSGWHFLSVPKKRAAEIKKAYAGKTRGWGSLPVEAKVGKTLWKSSIFPEETGSGTILETKKHSKVGNRLF